MNKTLSLRPICKDDWKTLLEWRNNPSTYKNYHTSQPVNESEHKEYISRLINDSNRSQYIIEYNGIAAGTIREEIINDREIRLSYTINPLFRGKKIGQLMMGLYLVDRMGIFICEIKEQNIASVRMIEKFGFKLTSKEKNFNTYKLNRLD